MNNNKTMKIFVFIWNILYDNSEIFGNLNRICNGLNKTQESNWFHMKKKFDPSFPSIPESIGSSFIVLCRCIRLHICDTILFDGCQCRRNKKCWAIVWTETENYDNFLSITRFEHCKFIFNFIFIANRYWIMNDFIRCFESKWL